MLLAESKAQMIRRVTRRVHGTHGPPIRPRHETAVYRANIGHETDVDRLRDFGIDLGLGLGVWVVVIVVGLSIHGTVRSECNCRCARIVT